MCSRYLYLDQVSIYIMQDENEGLYIIYFGNMAQNCQILRINIVRFWSLNSTIIK